MTDRADASAWIAGLAAIVDAPTAAAALERVLDATAGAVPHAALFLVRGGRLRGWRCHGHDEACTSRLVRVDLDPTTGWLAALFDPAAPLVIERRGGEPDPEFGQVAADEAMAAAIRIGATPIALLLGERSLGEEPWSAALLGSLAVVGRLRLELDLVRRRAVPVSQEPSALPDPLAPDLVAPPPSLPIRPLQPESALVPIEEADALPRTTAREREARRFARLVASDIRLYNEEDVLIGRSRGDLASRLERALARGRESFVRRFPDLGAAGRAILEEAYVEVLAAGDATLIGTPATARDL